MCLQIWTRRMFWQQVFYLTNVSIGTYVFVSHQSPLEASMVWGECTTWGPSSKKCYFICGEYDPPHLAVVTNSIFQSWHSTNLVDQEIHPSMALRGQHTAILISKILKISSVCESRHQHQGHTKKSLKCTFKKVLKHVTSCNTGRYAIIQVSAE